MFEEYSYEYLLKEAKSNADEDIDTREGSIFLDAVSPCMLLLAMCFTQAGIMYDQLQLRTATGESLDLKGSERLVERARATSAQYKFVYKGKAPAPGAVFYSEDGIYFTLLQAEDGTLYLESIETGTQMNDIVKGSNAIPVETYTDLQEASFGDLIIPARDIASDDEYRQDIYDSIVPGENGNIQHYKNWCREADEGVGHARIFPLHDGPNTVLAIIIAADGTAATPELLKKVQEYVDPDEDGDGKGDGLGEGAANIGAHFRCIAPVYDTIPITLTGVKANEGYTNQQAAETISKEIGEYFKQLARTEENRITVYASDVGAQIQALDCMAGYETISLSLRGSTSVHKKVLSDTDIPKIGRVDVDGTIVNAKAT